jgi:glycopeptide antibiotics resistance protein
MQDILKKSSIFLLSLVISWFLLYFFIWDIVRRLMTSSIILNIIIMIVTVFILYFTATSIVYKRFNKFYVDVISFLYFILVIGLTFFKSSYDSVYFNLNPLSIIREFQDYFKHALILLVSNTLIYVPLGIYIAYKSKLRALELFRNFIVYIVVIEFLQTISHRGIFDINDIIANTIGFLLGVLFYKVIRIRYGRQKIWS